MVGSGRGSSGFHGHRGELVAHVHLPSDTYYCTHVHMVGVWKFVFILIPRNLLLRPSLMN